MVFPRLNEGACQRHPPLAAAFPAPRETPSLGSVRSLSDRLLAELDRHGWLRPGEALLVAVSGGADSVVLLHALHRLSAQGRWRLAVAHFDHRLRPTSAAEQQWVASLSRRLRLPFHAGSGDVQGFARSRRLSLEMAARRMRHEFLARTARSCGFPKVALGHHADDQVETFFLQLFRGSSTRALAGMQPLAPSPADPAVCLVRPLLPFRRAELRAWAETEGLTWWEDPTNAGTDVLRNRVRHRLLPVIEAEFGPESLERIRRSMELLGAETAWVREAAAAWLTAPSEPPFDELPVALQRAVLVAQMRRLGVEPTFQRVEFLRRHPDRMLTVGPERFLMRDMAGRVQWSRPGLPPFLQARTWLRLQGDHGQAEFAGGRLCWARCPGRPEPSQWSQPPPGRMWFDAEAVGSEITLRHWQPGDRFQPLGMATAVRLQDLFTNLKIDPQERRQRVVAVRSDGLIFWVEGLRPGHLVRLRPDTRITLSWEWRRAVPSSGRTA